MPIGFPAYDEAQEEYPGLKRKDLLRAAEDALDDLRWRPRRVDRHRLVASVPGELLYGFFWTMGAKVTAEVEEEALWVRSEGSFPFAWLDIGQHRQNIVRFLKRLDRVLD